MSSERLRTGDSFFHSVENDADGSECDGLPSEDKQDLDSQSAVKGTSARWIGNVDDEHCARARPVFRMVLPDMVLA